MRIVELNIQHAGRERAARIADQLVAARADVAVLTEVAPGLGAELLLGRLAGAGLVHSVVGAIGPLDLPYTVAIASRAPITATRLPFSGTRYLQAAVEARIAGVLVTGLYVPLNRTQPRTRDHDACWIECLAPYAARVLGESALLIGDWNTGADADIGGGRVPGMAQFSSLLSRGWTDAWRACNGDETEYSWFHRATGNGFRIDHGLLAPGLVERLVGATYLHQPRESGVTDHSALAVEVTGCD